MTGIGQSMRQLNAAGIRFFLKGVDHYGPIFEAHHDVDPLNQNNHTLVFRLSDRDDVYTFDTPLYHHPDYINNPEGAADIHWNMTLQYLPPEFNKERVWLELTNEVDRTKCEWLGRFALHIAKKANALGYKVALFGWASGEPEPVGWEEPSMLDFLRYCADNLDKCALSIHEYSYIIDPIDHQYPFKIGRFQYLFATCDKHKIARPTTLITEWGWTLDSVPDPTKALQDIEKIGKLYAPYPNILGAAIWYLGPGFGNIANKAQKLIQPLTDWTLNNYVEYNEQDIPQLPKVGDWEQYKEDNVTSQITIQIEDPDYFIGQIRGVGSGKVTNMQYRWLYHNGQESVYGNWIGVPDVPDLDIRGIEFLLTSVKTIEKTIEIECGTSPQLKINDNDIGIDVSYWQL